LSEIETAAKKNYQRQIQELFKFLQHPNLFQDAQSVKTAIIDPNYNSLLYLNHALSLFSDLSDEGAATIDSLVEELAKLVEEVRSSELETRLKVVLIRQLTELRCS
jgi:hypothetical protein